ncbi:MAG: NADH-quinone oxidoreductase subunit H [bacterium]|nr:NADH-quinone oxidoreductase subunit H [bacterium]
MAEYASMYVICALAAILFLGGWHGPIPRPEVGADASLGGIWAQNIGQALGQFDAELPWWRKLSVAAMTLGGTVFQGEGLKIVAHQVIGIVNLLIKAFGLYFVMIWVRWTLPRIRIDQVMYLCLKVLLPFSLACVAWAAVQAVLVG